MLAHLMLTHLLLRIASHNVARILILILTVRLLLWLVKAPWLSVKLLRVLVVWLHVYLICF